MRKNTDDYQRGYKDGFDRGYIQGRISRNQERKSPDVIFVTEADQEKYPELGLPLGIDVKIIKDLMGTPISYEPL